ncbi:hypothetical protein MesoLjLc_42740 [Mesorhizobium sp. L-8-10]|uniref:nuclear transport factor 2 family protein n=1 Tax=Mesorhizobium sp. L-8-10 TaxID=2744523 RepID=UPI0019261724|nr:nuclear transport factor 2 family protein [Mesorhizobium sp. L-8-10]BCH32344.1 hypothetical protein MesoLjLc_42740 [Mesorhizobium sp. L-8-10]
MTDVSVTSLLDRDAIRGLMDHYCLALFAADARLLHALYWPGAHEEHGDYRGTAEGFVEQLAPNLRQRISTVACLAYRTIDFVSSTEAEAHGFGHITVVSGPSEARTSALLATRYDDLVEKRDGEWRIRQRTASLIFKREL